MIQIRKSVFETNSSSSHSLTMGSDDIVEQPFSAAVLRSGVVELAVGEYGWEWRRYYQPKEKLAYLLTQITNGKIESGEPSEVTRGLRKEDPRAEMLCRVVEAHTGCELVFNASEGYIDHQSAAGDGGNGLELFDDESVLRKFIFNSESCIQTGNDNDAPPWTIKTDRGPELFFESFIRPVDADSRSVLMCFPKCFRDVLFTTSGAIIAADRDPEFHAELMSRGVAESANLHIFGYNLYESKDIVGVCAEKLTDPRSGEPFAVSRSFTAQRHFSKVGDFQEHLLVSMRLPKDLADSVRLHGAHERFASGQEAHGKHGEVLRYPARQTRPVSAVSPALQEGRCRSQVGQEDRSIAFWEDLLMVVGSDLLASYRNGGYQVDIHTDGTKVRTAHDADDAPRLPEQMDFKLTDYCDAGCAWCHEKSTPKGLHGNVDRSVSLLKALPAGVEVAIGGGDPLSHPEFERFVREIRAHGLIPSVTVNGRHLERHRALLEALVHEGQLFGVGVSYSKEHGLPKWDYEHMVLHLIAGIDHPAVLDEATRRMKVLVLGYKQFGRGKKLFEIRQTQVQETIDAWYRELFTVARAHHLSFDNLAIDQLKPARLFQGSAGLQKPVHGTGGPVLDVHRRSHRDLCPVLLQRGANALERDAADVLCDPQEPGVLGVFIKAVRSIPCKRTSHRSSPTRSSKGPASRSSSSTT